MPKDLKALLRVCEAKASSKVKIVNREKANRESYILYEAKYWAGVTEKCTKYKLVVKELANDIGKHISTDNAQAKDWLAYVVDIHGLGEKRVRPFISYNI